MTVVYRAPRRNPTARERAAANRTPYGRLLAQTNLARPPAFLVVAPEEIRGIAEELARVRTKEVRSTDQWVRRIVNGKASIRGIRIRVGRP